MHPTIRLICRGFGAVLASLAAATFLASPLHAHEEGVLRVASRSLAAGDSVRVVGEHFSKRSSIRLVLEGVAGRIDLVTVKTDSAGAFSLVVGIAADQTPGAYRLVALADDGDVAASLDVAVAAAATGPVAADPPAMEPPTAASLDLPRAHSPFVTWSVLAGIGLSLGLGLTLLRRPPSA